MSSIQQVAKQQCRSRREVQIVYAVLRQYLIREACNRLFSLLGYVHAQLSHVTFPSWEASMHSFTFPYKKNRVDPPSFQSRSGGRNAAIPFLRRRNYSSFLMTPPPRPPFGAEQTRCCVSLDILFCDENLSPGQFCLQACFQDIFPSDELHNILINIFAKNNRFVPLLSVSTSACLQTTTYPFLSLRCHPAPQTLILCSILPLFPASN